MCSSDLTGGFAITKEEGRKERKKKKKKRKELLVVINVSYGERKSR